MTDGADYPGYPEPEPEGGLVSKLRAVAIPLWNSFIHLFDAFLAAGKMVTASILGAFMGVELNRFASGESSIDGLMYFYVAFTIVYIAYYGMKKVVESGVLYR